MEPKPFLSPDRIQTRVHRGTAGRLPSWGNDVGRTMRALITPETGNISAGRDGRNEDRLAVTLQDFEPGIDIRGMA